MDSGGKLLRNIQDIRNTQLALALSGGPLFAVLGFGVAVDAPCRFIGDHQTTFGILSIIFGGVIYHSIGNVFARIAFSLVSGPVLALLASSLVMDDPLRDHGIATGIASIISIGVVYIYLRTFLKEVTEYR
jgi:hypothetical protein